MDTTLDAVSEEAVSEEAVSEETVSEETVSKETMAKETATKEAVTEEATSQEAVSSRTGTAPSPVQLSARALLEVKKILTEKDIPDGFGLRIGVKGGGCSGMSYILGFDRQRDHDVTFAHEGVKIVIDKRHGLYLMGTTVDYQDGLDARGFTFENPNATSTCGCGSSFGV